MGRKSYVLIIITLLLITSLLASCGQPQGQESITTDTDKAPQQLKITDMEGRDIIIDGEINRIVAIGSALRLYTYVNGTDKLVGVEGAQQSPESGRPYILANPQLAELPLVGEGHPSNPDPELLLGVNPDVIIAGNIMDREQIQHIQDTIGVPIVMITTGNSAVFDEDMYQAIRIIGQITSREERAEDIINYMEDCKQELAELTKDIPEEEKPSVYVGGLSHKGSHGIESTATKSPLLSAIYAKNVADELKGQGSVMIDKEQIVKWDPDIIIIDQNGLNIVKDDYKKNPDFYNMLSAVKNSKVYGQLPYVSYYNNIETALADVYFAGKILYPYQFEDIDPADKADEIYEFFLGEPLYKVMAEKYGGYGEVNLQ